MQKHCEALKINIMKIPLAYTELGYFYPFIDGTYYFVQCAFSYSESMYGKYRKGTWEEFKELYPYTVYSNGSHVRHRCKNKKN